MKHNTKDIAAAVNSHVKALRLLGRTQTSYSEIGAALHISAFEVSEAFKAYRIVKASVKEGYNFNPERGEFSRVVQLQ